MECENCGRKASHFLKINKNGDDHFFDSFECAINQLAERCGHCDTRIIGHSIESDSETIQFCCDHCKEMYGTNKSVNPKMKGEPTSATW